MAVTVIDSSAKHLVAVAAIYAAEVSESAATFDLVSPAADYWHSVLDGPHLFLVALNESGAVAGYARTGRFRDRAAYDTTVETSVYVDAEHRGAGVGNALYAELLARLQAGPQRVAIAGITQPNEASMRLHVKHGFAVVGTFTDVGIKFGRPWDVTFLQREL